MKFLWYLSNHSKETVDIIVKKIEILIFEKEKCLFTALLSPSLFAEVKLVRERKWFKRFRLYKNKNIFI